MVVLGMNILSRGSSIWSFKLFKLCAHDGVVLGVKIRVDMQLNYGHIDCLRYAHENGCPWNENTCLNAALHGHLDLYTFMHMRMVVLGIKIRVDMQLNMDVWIVYAMLMRMVVLGMNSYVNMQLDMDIWIVYAMHMRMVVPWNETTCQYAAQHGRLDCLRYAHENGCPWDKVYVSIYSSILTFGFVYAMLMRMVALGMKIHVYMQL